MDPESWTIVLFTSTTKGVQNRISIDRRTPPNTTTVYESTTVQILRPASAHLVLFVRKGGEGVFEPMTWRDPLLVVSARRCLSPCPNPSPALRASFGFKPISSVYLSIYVENYQNKLPPISALQSQWALSELSAADCCLFHNVSY